MSDLEEVWVNLGSTLMSFPPFSLAFSIHLKDTG
jgi:hypothetical protein